MSMLLLLALILLLCTVGCGSNKKDEVTDNNIDTESKDKIQTALDNLKSFEGDYIISNVIEAPDGKANYLDVKTSNGSYTEYPVESNDKESGEVSYSLSDWLSANNKDYYILVTDDKNNTVFAKCPNDYAELCSSRNLMYMDKMLDNFTSIKYMETVTSDIGNGSENIELYRCELPSDVVTEVLGVNTLGLYSSIQKNYTDNEDIQKFCEYYLRDLKMSMTFSDAVVTVGISDNLLKYVSIEVGGLGTRLYSTRALITKNVEVRDVPDLSNSVDYITTIQDYASYIASFGSYEEAVKNMNKNNSNINGQPETESSSEE